jgi:hypothetical protein
MDEKDWGKEGMNKNIISSILLIILVLTGCFGGCTIDDTEEGAEMIFPVTTTVESTQEIEITDVFCTYDEELSCFYFTELNTPTVRSWKVYYKYNYRASICYIRCSPYKTQSQ